MLHSKYLIATSGTEGNLSKFPCASVPKHVLLTGIIRLMFFSQGQHERFLVNIVKY